MATKLQQTIAVTNSSFPNFRIWAGDATGIAAALQTLGFVKQADTYTAQWANGTTIGVTALPTNAGNIGGAAFGTVTNTARPAVPIAGAAFRGAWVGGTSYVVGDVVTDTTTAQIVFICTTNTSSATAPINLAANWSPYWMEIWKMAGSGGTSDVYIKFEYGGGATNTNPLVFVQWGTAYTPNSGVLSGNFTTCEQFLVGTATIASGECTWVGDGANYFGTLLGRAQANTNMMWFERAISGQVSNAPVYSTTSQYVAFGKTCGAAVAVWSAALFLSGTVAESTRINAWLTCAITGAASASYVSANLTPCFPVFPMVGYLGNPVTVVTTQVAQDSIEGATITANVYGASHSYLTTKTAPYSTVSTGVSPAAHSVGLRFE